MMNLPQSCVVTEKARGRREGLHGVTLAIVLREVAISPHY